MTPEISEFSYGFSLTHELVGKFGPLRAAPIFPSLIEEGRAGGGYDVNLNAPGLMLYLQFKRSDCMIRRSAREIRDGATLTVPFYRMKITERSRSAQHEMLLDLDDGTNEVFYAAPRFHTPHELNNAWHHSTVARRSIFVKPKDIGNLDDRAHHIAFDNTHAYLCSEPKPISTYFGETLGLSLFNKFQKETRALNEGPITEALNKMRRAQSRASERYRGQIPPTDQQRISAPAKIRQEFQDLRELSDTALQTFGAQIFILQQK